MAKTHKIRTKFGGIIEVRSSCSEAIRLFCTECMGWESHPNECTAIYCPLYAFRGKKLDAVLETCKDKQIPESEDRK